MDKKIIKEDFPRPGDPPIYLRKFLLGKIETSQKEVNMYSIRKPKPKR